jgi:hypothetical protein
MTAIEDSGRNSNVKCEILSANCENCFTKFNDRVAREVKESSTVDNISPIKSNNLTSAIFAFSNCVLIIKKSHNYDLQPSSQEISKNKSTNQKISTKNKALPPIGEYLVSSFNFLAFLYSTSAQNIQALNTCNQALVLQGLSSLQRTNFIQIKLRSLAKLKKTTQLSQELTAFEQKEKPSEVNCQFYYPLVGRSQVLTANAGIISRVYKLILSMQGGDHQKSKQLIDGLMSDLAKKELLKVGQELEPMMRHLLYYYNYRIRFSRENLEKLLSPLTDLSTVNIK